MIRATKALRELPVDLIEWGETVEGIVSATSADAIAGNGRDLLAPERGVELVGEISGRLLRRQDEWSRRFADEELHRAYDMRHRLAHVYDAESSVRLHGIAQVNVAALTANARLWQAEIDADGA